MTTETDADIGTDYTPDAAASVADPTPVSDAAADPDPAPQPDTDPAASEGDKPKQDGLQKRFDELTRKRYEERQRAEAAERRIADLEAKLAGNAKPEAEPTAQPETYTRADLEREAARMADERALIADRTRQANDFSAKCNTVFEDGLKAFGEPFRNAVGNLNMAGVISETNQTLLRAVLETDAPAAVLNELGKDPDKAEGLLKLSPYKLGAELSRMAEAASKAPPAPPLSKAPAPIAPVGGDRAKDTVDLYADDVDDAAWFAEREAQRRARG